MKKSALRQKIVRTAAGLFYRNGYNSTGINEIIQESGIAKATLYNHFRSKDDLCLAYLQYMHQNFLKDIKAYCFSKPETRRRILAIFDFVEELFNDNEFNGCWCIKTASELPKDDEKIRSEIQKQKNQFIDLIKDLTQVNFKGKPTKQRNSKVRQIYLLYESAVGESYLHQTNWPIKEAKAICSQII